MLERGRESGTQNCMDRLICEIYIEATMVEKGLRKYVKMLTKLIGRIMGD